MHSHARSDYLIAVRMSSPLEAPNGICVRCGAIAAANTRHRIVAQEPSDTRGTPQQGFRSCAEGQPVGSACAGPGARTNSLSCIERSAAEASQAATTGGRSPRSAARSGWNRVATKNG